MKGLRNLLLTERERLAKILQVTEKRLRNSPEGTLRVSKNRKYTQYYHCAPEHKTGKYITKGNEPLAYALAQKAYDEKKPYMNKLNTVVLTAIAVIIPILGFLPGLTMDNLANLAQGFSTK